MLLDLVALASTASAFAVGYGPTDQRCPNYAITRAGSGGLNIIEEDWVAERNMHTQPALRKFLATSNMDGFDANAFMARTTKNPVKIGLAFSGGGFRAMLTGAGMLSAMDSRVTSKGVNLGGLLQSATYISGLSGGSWLVGSVASNNWTTIPQLQKSAELWNFQSPFQTSEKSGLDLKYDISIVMDIAAKSNAQYPTSITDVWGRLLSAQLFDGKSNHGRQVLWSDLAYWPGMADHTMPLPFIVTDGIYMGNNTVLKNAELAALRNGQSLPLNTTVYEISPFEFGTWDPNVSRFMETMYLGTELMDGTPTTIDCTVGYDNAGFLMGTSSSIFNMALGKIASGTLRQVLNQINPNWYKSDQTITIGLIGPNPFQGINGILDVGASPNLAMADGGENGENIPLDPLIQNARDVDVVFAADSSADTHDNWPNGAALYETYRKQFIMNTTTFPYVPPPEALANLGLDGRPVFFGCEEYQPGIPHGDPPLVVWMPNSQVTYPSNTSTFKLNYSAQERDAMIYNGYNIMTQREGTLDPAWRTCVACAIILRSQQRDNITPTSQCSRCLQKYCFNGFSSNAISQNSISKNIQKTSSFFNGFDASGDNALFSEFLFNDGRVVDHSVKQYAESLQNDTRSSG